MLEDRTLLAVLTVGANAQFSTIQSAVENARNGDEIVLNAESFAESVDLSRLGSAVGSQPGAMILRGTNDQSFLRPATGAAIFNSGPLAARVTIDGIRFAAANGSPNVSGIRLVQFDGDLSVRRSEFRDLTQKAIVLRDFDGGLLIEDNTFRNIGNAAGHHAIVLENYEGIGAISRNTIEHAADTGIVIMNSGDREASLLVNENVIRGDDAFLATTDVGLSINLAGSTRTDLSLDRNTLEALAQAGFAVSVAVNAQLQTRWTRNVISNIHGPRAMDIALADGSQTVLLVQQNTVLDTRNDAWEARISGAASLRGVVRQNEFISVGDGSGDDALTMLGEPAANGDVSLLLDSNGFTTVTGTGMRLAASGSGRWVAQVSENVFTEVNTRSGEAALLVEQPGAGNSADLTLAVTANIVLDGGQAAYALHQRGAGPFRLTGTAAYAADQIAATNTGGPIVADGTITIVAPGTILDALPLVVGDRVWIDADGDGIQDDSEQGLARVLLSLAGTETGSGRAVDRTTQTDAIGAYFFAGLAAGSYTVTIHVPQGFRLTQPEQGNSRTLDSNFVIATAATAVTLAAGADDRSVDAGLLTTWQNPRRRWDVNNDGFVVPGDALILVNELNRTGPRPLTLPAFNADQPPPFFDVNGDGFLAPLDVLAVVNFLNNGPSGEGESAASLAEGEAGTATPPALVLALPIPSDLVIRTRDGWVAVRESPDDDREDPPGRLDPRTVDEAITALV